MTWGLVDALSMIATDPAFGPSVFGEKVTRMAQLAPGATVTPHVEVMANGPFTVLDEMDSAVRPVLLRVTVFGLLVVPTL